MHCSLKSDFDLASKVGKLECSHTGKFCSVMGRLTFTHITEFVEISIDFLHKFKICYTKNSYQDFVSLQLKKALKTIHKMNAKF